MGNIEDICTISVKIDEMAKLIATYLNSVILENKRIPARSFYGESFAALLLSKYGIKYQQSIELLYEAYEEKNKNDQEFHWEFNKYAWTNILKQTKDKSLRKFVFPLKFKNTEVVNWTLLRSCTRFHAAMELEHAIKEARTSLWKFQKPSGLICDQSDVRSFQYHCFSSVLIAEIYELGGGDFFLERFCSAAEFISKFILRTGDVLYIGRGQEQSFGYGTILYLLALSYKYSKDKRYLGHLQRCLLFLSKYQRKDGSFPLTMNKQEMDFPLVANPSDPRYPGWYHYNNYFDYLPFLGVFFQKAVETLESLSNVKITENVLTENYKDKDFLIFRNDVYEAVLSKPGGDWRGTNGYWTNDLPIPYVSFKGQRVTASYGGEQYDNTLYTAEGIPLPLVIKNKRKISIRRGRVWSFFWGNSMIIVCLSGIVIRHFRFHSSSIDIADVIISLKPMYENYLFEQVRQIDNKVFHICQGAKIISSTPLEKQKIPQYFWGGELQELVSKEPIRRNKITISMEGVK